MNSLVTHVRLDERGRLVLPAALRERLGIHTGDKMLLIEQADGVIRLESQRAAARSLIGLGGHLAHSAVAELRELRELESASADSDAQEAPQ